MTSTDQSDHEELDSWLPLLATAVALGAAGGLAALGFVAVVAAGQDVVWPDELDPSAFSGSFRILIAMTVGGLLVGIIHALVPTAEEENVFVALATGRINAQAIPGGVAMAAITLIAGFSLGPEVPTGMAAAGIAALAVSRRLVPPSRAEVASSTAITGAWGGLFTAPFTALLLNVELGVERRTLDWARLAADATAAIVGFAIFFAVEAGWADVLRLLQLPQFELGLNDLALAIGFGLVGALAGTLFKLSIAVTRRLAAPLTGRPILRCTGLGFVLGLLGMALPLTLFLGTDGLAEATSDPAALGAGLILISVAAKIFATSAALSFGFVGGPVFPLLFVGGGIGAAIHLGIDDIPLALAVTATMAAVPAAVIPVPLSIATLTVLIAGIGPTESTAVFTAAMVSTIAARLIQAALPSPRAEPPGR